MSPDRLAWEEKHTDLERRGGVREIEHLYVPLRGADDHERVHHVHGITAFRELNCRHRVWRAEIPVLRHGINVERACKRGIFEQDSP